MHVRGHGYLMSHSIQKVEGLDHSMDLNKYFEFIFSKLTSDNFTLALINVFEIRKHLLQKFSFAIESGQERVSVQKTTTVDTKSRMIEILKELGYSEKEELSKNAIGVPELIVLFRNFQKHNLISQDLPKSNFALALSILTGYSFRDFYNRISHFDKGMSELFKQNDSENIHLKLAKLSRKCDEIKGEVDMLKMKN